VCGAQADGVCKGPKTSLQTRLGPEQANRRKDHTYAKRQKVHAESEGSDPAANISDASDCTNDAYSCEGSQATGTPVGLPVPVLRQRSKHIVIVYYYVHVLEAPGPQCWQGRSGTIAQIRKNLRIPKGSSVIIKVLINVRAKMNANEEYDGSEPRRQPSPLRAVKSGSVQAQIICDALEIGTGVTEATLLVNDCGVDNT